MSLPVAQELRNKRHALKRAERALRNAGLSPHMGLNDKVATLRIDEACEVVDHIRSLINQSGRIVDGHSSPQTNIGFLNQLADLNRFFR